MDRDRTGATAPAAQVDAANTGRFGMSRPVWLLGWVSLFTDTASEIVYPLLPIFLTRVLGAGAMSLGVIEGVAEAANSILKILSGWLADRSGSAKRFVLAGYTLASVVRPLIALVTAWPQVLAIRFADRVGKGIRGAPRDAMLASFATEHTRGRVFGFNRAMDHTGAVIGPLLATAFLYFYPEHYRPLFALTLIPGAIVVLILLRVPERARVEASGRSTSARGALSSLPPAFYRAMAVIFIFSLGNASDAFLLLRLTDLGVAAVWIPLLWSALHVVKASASVLGGTLSDRLGRRTLIAAGWFVYAVVYGAFGVFDSKIAVITFFLIYGLYFGLTEGAEKAWVADLTTDRTRGIAFGVYNAVLGIGSLAASLLFGLIWTHVSPHAAFFTGGALALGAAAMLQLVGGPPRAPQRD